MCNLYRPEAETAADRTLVKMANLPAKTHVASPGWVISSVVLLPRQASQGTFVLDTVRVRSTGQATEVAARSWRAVVALLVTRGLRPIILGDRWYACAPFLARMADVDASCAVRVSKAIASFIARPQSGSPDKREPRALMGSVGSRSDERTHGQPDETWEGTDDKGAKVEVRCWNHLHLRTARWVELSRVLRHPPWSQRKQA